MNFINNLTEIKYEQIKNVGIWDTVINNMILLYKLCEHSNENELKYLLIQFCKKYIYVYVKKLFRKIGWIDTDTESIIYTRLRPILIKFLELVKDEEIIKEAQDLFKTEKYEHVLEIVGTYATKQEYSKLIKLLKHNTDPHLKDDIIIGLSVTTNDKFIDYMISHILLNEIKEQDINKAIHNLSLNNKALHKLWNFIKNNWSTILKTHAPSSGSLTRMCKSIASGMCTVDMLKDYIDFFKKHKPEGTDMIVKQTIENIAGRIKIIKRMKEDNDFINLLKK
jgi:hypothetical protein